MSLVAKLLSPAHIALDLPVSSKKRLFEQAGLLFENQHGVARSLVFDSLFARERLGSTGLGQGVAIPHGRIKGLKEAPPRSTCRSSPSWRRCSRTSRCAS
jgi:PTS system nitrogen regulatory IIA component